MPAATAIRERPIIFSAPMIRAILDGRKTQTRRVMKGVNGIGEDDMDWRDFPHYGMDAIRFEDGHAVFEYQTKVDDTSEFRVKCPYGSPGDRLWCRETWAANAFLNLKKPGELRGETIYYRATYPNDSHFVWRPSIHMPRWASRITLEITEVRCERLQAITEEDARAEGVYDAIRELDGRAYDEMERKWCRSSKAIDPKAGVASAVGLFVSLWDKINGTRAGCSWSDNPWTWVVSFKRID